MTQEMVLQLGRNALEITLMLAGPVLLFGLVAGLIARAIVPGRQSMGVLATVILGIVGSFVGGLLGSLFSSDGNLIDLRPSGILWSIIGAVVVLLLVGLAGRRRVV